MTHPSNPSRRRVCCEWKGGRGTPRYLGEGVILGTLKSRLKGRELQSVTWRNNQSRARAPGRVSLPLRPRSVGVCEDRTAPPYQPPRPSASRRMAFVVCGSPKCKKPWGHLGTCEGEGEVASPRRCSKQIIPPGSRAVRMDTQSVAPAAQPVAPAATPRATPAKTSRGIVKKKGWSLARVVYSKNCLLLCRNGLIVRMEEPGLGRNMVMVRGPPPAVHPPSLSYPRLPMNLMPSPSPSPRSPGTPVRRSGDHVQEARRPRVARPVDAVQGGWRHARRRPPRPQERAAAEDARGHHIFGGCLPGRGSGARQLGIGARGCDPVPSLSKGGGGGAPAHMGTRGERDEREWGSEASPPTD